MGASREMNPAGDKLTAEEFDLLEGLKRLRLAHPAELSAEVLVQPDVVRR